MTTNDFESNETGDSIDHTDPNVLRELYYEKRHTLMEIADMSGVSSASTIRHHMDKHGLERRTTGEGGRVNRATYSMEGNGYMSWHSRDPDGKQRGMKVHRLVAILEYGIDAVAGAHVHHKNEIPWDNRPENLELKEPSDHHSHHSSGESHPGSKLTERDVTDIRNRIGGSETQREIAKEYDVSESTISMIKSGDLWPGVGSSD